MSPKADPRPELGPWPRFGAVLLSWALIYLSQPGVGRQDGFGHLGFVALVPWALAASRPGRRAFLAEWLASAIGVAAMTLWMRHLLPFMLVPMGLIPGLYPALAGVLLRHLARRFPLALAAPAAFLFGEMARWFPVPLSFGWWRLGFVLHDTTWLAGSARLWGVWGLTWVLGAFAGLVADGVRSRGGVLAGHTRPLSAAACALGLGPLLVGIGASALTAPPPTEPGPRLLLVTPGLEQVRKSSSDDPARDKLLLPGDLTAEGLAASSERPVDLVCWGETMLEGMRLAEGVPQALQDGINRPAWAGRGWEAAELDFEQRLLNTVVNWTLFGRGKAEVPLLAQRVLAHPADWAQARGQGVGLLPPGTSFFSGLQAMIVHDDELWRINAASIWGPEGAPGPTVSKQHLVPAAEDPYPAVHVPFMTDMMMSLGGYIPDFMVVDDPRVVPLSGQNGRHYDVGLSICFDNSFDDPYTRPLREGPLDFHLVASNEAWYEDSYLMDHMCAFSRLRALTTGRAIVRATNSGATVGYGPDGALLGQLEVDGSRKMVGGPLLIDVPVPVAGRAAERTPYVASEGLQILLRWLLLLFLTIWAARP